MKRCCFSSNPEEIVTPKEKRLNNVTRNDIIHQQLLRNTKQEIHKCKYELVLQDSTVILSIRCDGNFYVQEAKSTESVIICIHGTRLPSGEETTSSADRSDRSVEGGSGVLIHPGSSQRKS
ncbi:hypothetical protein T4C_6390 [Trichinella pseudospiralis]|uniref:Uncharacterized protein n=1 Tax=Trichinella pseudospiralis TaxID=6337 RepID=A0A0V1IBK9_TRIPS|nr:hypothetical protein T4C_6390 [Trichinella pseudospiralis]